MNYNVTDTIKIVIFIFKKKDIVFTSKEIEKELNVSKSIISLTIKKLIDCWEVFAIEWLKWVFYKSWIINWNSLYNFWSKIYEDSILTWNLSLELQWVKKKTWIYKFDYCTFEWRKREIKSSELDIFANFLKEDFRKINDFYKEIKNDLWFLYYSIEKSYLDKVKIDLSNWIDKRYFDDDIDFSKFDLDKLKILSKSYSSKIQNKILKEIEHYEKYEN